MKPKIIIVDENDQEIGQRERGTLEDNEIYRVSALWLTNSQGEILLAQRSFNKKNNPGKWGPAVAGTIDEGESYLENIIKETEEEIGIKNIEVQEEFKLFNDGEYKHFTQWYSAILDKKIDEFKIQEEEVEQIKWFTKKELKTKLKKYPEKFLKSLPDIFKKFIK